MPKFKVTLTEDVNYVVTVEAENQDIARWVAEDVFLQTDITKLTTVVRARKVSHVEPASADAELTAGITAGSIQTGMLAALKRAEFVMSSSSIIHLTNGGGALDEVRAAIANAEGRRS